MSLPPTRLVVHDSVSDVLAIPTLYVCNLCGGSVYTDRREAAPTHDHGVLQTRGCPFCSFYAVMLPADHYLVDEGGVGDD